MDNNISNIKDCYGCGVCAIICPHNLIKIELNKDGFYEPLLLNESSCTNCGLCISVCSYNDDNISIVSSSIIKQYATWSNDELIRKSCSSGGIGFELGSSLIKQGYNACGVKFNPELNRAEHFNASTIEEFLPSIGSKYIQSYTLTGFSEFVKGEKYFISGTPCQIDSIRRYIKKCNIEDDFVLMDFFCHGVPSMNLWKKYTDEIEKQTGKILDASWRSKLTGWHDSWCISINGDKEVSYRSLLSKGDMFFKFFLSDTCLGKACYDRCKYKYEKSAADIRIGDLWGTKYKQNKEGVSALLVLTEKGNEIITNLDNCSFVEEPLSVVAEGQMKVSPKRKQIRKYMLKAFETNTPIYYIYNFYRAYIFPIRFKNKVKRVLSLRN